MTARAVDRPRHAPFHRERDERWHLDAEQALRQGEQPAGRRIWPKEADELLNVLEREQPVQLGDEPATAKKQLQEEASHTHRIAEHENERKLEEGVDSGGRPRVPRRAARGAQQLPAHTSEKGDKTWADIVVPTEAPGRSSSGAAEKWEAGADSGGQRKLRGPLQKLADISQTGVVPDKGA